MSNGVSAIIIIMGVSGSGKSTVGLALSNKTGIPFYDADDYHPKTNLKKMESGQALTDDDRWPWLAHLSGLLLDAESKNGAILACSALKSSYRELLEKPLIHPPKWVYLNGNKDLIAERMRKRSGHFMPLALLDSQLAALEPPTNATVVAIDQPLSRMIDEIQDHLQLYSNLL